MNNSVFGMTMENLRKRQRVSIVQPITDPKKYKKLTSDPSFKSQKIFSENLVAIHRRKTEVNLNRPTYIGSAGNGTGQCPWTGRLGLSRPWT